MAAPGPRCRRRDLRKAAHHARLALGRAARYEREAETLAGVVMRLPGWDAALEEVRGHVALASGAVARSTERFRAAAAAFREAGRPSTRSGAQRWRSARPDRDLPGTFREHPPETFGPVPQPTRGETAMPAATGV